MAGIGPETGHPERRDVIVDSTGRGPMRHDREETRTTAKVLAGGSLTEALAGLAAAALAIIALAGVLPGYLAAIATIAVGVALLAQGGAVATRWSRIVAETPGYEWDPKTELGSGMTGEILGGAAGIVLGILALIGVAPQILIPVALLVFGGAMLVGTGTAVDLGTMRTPVDPRVDRSTREIAVAASGTQMLIGIAAIVLGILALIGIDPLTLSLVGLLAAGASILFSGSAVSARVLTLLRR
jgi:hypothetical protein